MPPFHVADLDPQGELQLLAQYQYDELERLPGAGEMIGAISGALWQSIEEFDLPLDGGLHLHLSSPAPTTAIASLRQEDGKLLSLSLLLTGLDAQSDSATIDALQSHLLHELHDTPFEPAFALGQIAFRPLVASIHLSPPSNSRLNTNFAMCDRCLAAAYFRRHGLA